MNEISGCGARAFRFLIGMVVIIDIAHRYSHIHELFVDDGLIPRSLRHRDLADLNLHMMCGSPICVTIIFSAHVAAAVRFMLPEAGRWDTFFLWIMQRSMVLRSIECSGGGEVFITRLLFFAMFAPLGLRGGSGITVAVLRLQICLMYWGSVGHKIFSSGGENWVGNFSATARALSIETYARETAVWLREAVSFDATRWLTVITLAGEIFGPLGLICPWSSARVAAVAGMAVMHLLFGTCLNIGTFHLFNIAALSLFFPFRTVPSLRPPSLPPRHGKRWKILSSLRVCIAVAFFLAYPVIQNFEYVRLRGPDARANSPIKTMLAPLGRAIPLDQRWHMFMGPPVFDRYIALPGRLFNSSFVRDVRSSSTATTIGPPDNHLEYSRGVEAVAWARYSNLLAKTWTALIFEAERNPSGVRAMTMINALGKFYCRRFNGNGSKEPTNSSLAWIDIIAVVSPIPGPEGLQPKPKPPATKKLSRHFCYLDGDTQRVLTVETWKGLNGAVGGQK